MLIGKAMLIAFIKFFLVDYLCIVILKFLKQKFPVQKKTK